MLAAFGTWGGWPALTAVGTIGAVIAAVGLQAWITLRARRHRPKLELALDEYHYTMETATSGGALPYLRVAVHNAPGKEAAQDVEVLVESVVGVGGGGVHRWLVNPALGWPNSLDPLPRMTIPPGVTRYIDIGWWLPRGSEIKVFQGRGVKGIDQLTLNLAVVPQPNSLRQFLPPGRYEITLAVAARNTDSASWLLELSFEEWPSGEGDPSKPRNLQAKIARAPGRAIRTRRADQRPGERDATRPETVRTSGLALILGERGSRLDDS